MDWFKPDIDKWQEIFNSIRRHKLRTILTAFGVFWGIFMLVIMLGAISGLQNSFVHSFRDDAVNSLWLHQGRTTKEYKGLNKGRFISFNNDDYKFLEEQFPEIDALTGRYYISGNLVKYKDKALSFSIRAVHPGHKIMENTVMSKGRYISDQDLKTSSKVAVIGDFVRKDLFPPDVDPIGKEISIESIIYKIVGVFVDSGGENEMRMIYLPVTTAQRVYSGGNDLHQLMLSGGDLTTNQMKELEERIRKAFAIRKQFDPTDTRAMRIRNRAEDFEQFSSLFFMFTLISWIVGVFSIMAGVIGVSNIMLIIVKDRTKEIGIRKAIGATPGSIVSMILQESILITGVAGYLGMLVGISIIFLVSGAEEEYFRHPQVNLGVIGIATAVLVIAGALAGLLPAFQAAKINPVKAIKSD